MQTLKCPSFTSRRARICGHLWLRISSESARTNYESNGIVTSITKEGVWTVGSRDFAYVDEESKTRTSDSRYRFFFRPFHESFWLYGKIAGHKWQAFQEALEIVEGLKSTAESIG